MTRRTKLEYDAMPHDWLVAMEIYVNDNPGMCDAYAQKIRDHFGVKEPYMVPGSRAEEFRDFMEELANVRPEWRRQAQSKTEKTANDATQ